MSDDLYVLGCFLPHGKDDSHIPLFDFSKEHANKMDMQGTPLLFNHNGQTGLIGTNLITIKAGDNGTNYTISKIDTSTDLGKLTAYRINGKLPKNNSWSDRQIGHLMPDIIELSKKGERLTGFSLGHLAQKEIDREKREILISKMPWEISVVADPLRQEAKILDSMYVSELGLNQDRDYIFTDFINKLQTVQDNRILLNEIMAQAVPLQAPVVPVPTPLPVTGDTTPQQQQQTPASLTDEWNNVNIGEINLSELATLGPKEIMRALYKTLQTVETLKQDNKELGNLQQELELEHSKNVQKLLDNVTAILGKNTEANQLEGIRDSLQKKLAPTPTKSIRDAKRDLEIYSTLVQAGNSHAEEIMKENEKLKQQLKDISSNVPDMQDERKKSTQRVVEIINKHLENSIGPQRTYTEPKRYEPYAQPTPIPPQQAPPKQPEAQKGFNIPPEGSYLRRGIETNTAIAGQYANLETKYGNTGASNVLNKLFGSL